MTSATVPTPAILLVDDREENLIAMEAALGLLGCRVVAVPSGEAALREMLRDDYSLVILDVQMPGLDGFETARAIKERERTRDVPILFVTAISRQDEHRLHGYETGGVDYLFKPVSPELLRAKAAVFVRLYQQHRQLLAQREELERQTAALERANHDLQQFTYIVSHDLQEPLRVVAGCLELLAERAHEVDDRARSLLEKASATAGRMGDLVSDLLMCARAGSSAAPAQPVELGRAVDLAVGNLATAVQETGGRVEVDENLPAVLAHDVEVVQVLQNVIGNSLRHHGEAASGPVVCVSARQVGDDVEIEVSDNGPGVPIPDLERVFGFFERIDSSPYPGTGLGLAICRRIVEQRGGRIWMTSNAPAPGATVHIALPAAGAA